MVNRSAAERAGDDAADTGVVGTPERFATVWCPDWPIVAAGYDPDRPAAVLQSHRVVARTDAAAADGVVIGQRRRQAQACCPQIELVEHDSARDARKFEPVVRAVADMAPRLDVIEPGWITLGIRGPSRYFGGDDTVAVRLVGLVDSALVGSEGSDQLGSGVQPDSAANRVAGVGVGVADGRFAASVAARLSAQRGVPVVIEPGGSPTFCASLAIGWLQTLGEVNADLVDLFTRLGLRRLGQLAKLSNADVLGRFGHPGVHARRLAAGLDERPAVTDDPPVEQQVAEIFDNPVEQSEAVLFVAKQLADDVARRLAAVGSVCTRLVVQFETEHGERSERSWYRSTGLTAAAMVERVRWQLDAWMRLPKGSEGEITAGVALVRLIPEEIIADHGVQLGLWGGQSDADSRAGAAIARLTTLTSEQAVTVPIWQGGRMPSERYRWVPATTVDLSRRAERVDVAALPGFVSVAGTELSTEPGAALSARANAVASTYGAQSAGAPWPGSLPAPSPATVYAEPVPIEVVDKRGAAIQVSGRGVVSATPVGVYRMLGDATEGWRRGLLRPVRAWAGPWPLDQRWWESAQHRRLARFQMIVGRDEQNLSDDVEQAVLVIAEHRRWWVIARYD